MPINPEVAEGFKAKKTEEKPVVKESGEGDRIRKTYMEALEEGLAIKGVATGLGVDPETMFPARASREPETRAAEAKAGIDLMKVVVEDSLKAARESGAETRKLLEGNLSYLRDELNALKGGPSDIQKYQEMKTLLDAMAGDIAQKLGGGVKPAEVRATDIPGLLQLEKVKQDGEERDRQWKQQMATMQHQWEVEMEEIRAKREQDQAQWKAEFGLKVREFEQGQTNRAKFGGMFEDLMASASESIDQKRKAGAAAPEPLAQARPGRIALKPKAFHCPDCKELIQVPSGAEEVECAGCHAAWSLKGYASPPTQAEPLAREEVKEEA